MHNNESFYLPQVAEVVGITEFSPREKFFEIKMPDGPLGHQPGQFVEVSVLGVGEAPISISSSPTKDGDTFEMCIRNTGSLTNRLHQLKVGDKIGIRGPYGIGFPVHDLTGYDLLFVAGGLGIVPLRSMINYAVDRRSEFGKITLLYGSRTPSDLLFAKDIEHWKKVPDFNFMPTVDVADESWTGKIGPITRLFDDLKFDPSKTMSLVVGPPVMFRYVLKAMLAEGIYESHIYLSMERRMKCGVGKCGHCQMDYVYVCQDGPVFPYTRVRNLQEAF
jgi:sulfite reductase subunit B